MYIKSFDIIDNSLFNEKVYTILLSEPIFVFDIKQAFEIKKSLLVPFCMAYGLDKFSCSIRFNYEDEKKKKRIK